MLKPQMLITLATLLFVTNACSGIVTRRDLDKKATQSAEKTAGDPSQLEEENALPPSLQEEVADGPVFTQDFLEEFCMRELVDLPGPYERKQLATVCQRCR